jgi:hypothetical protein
MGEQTCVLVVGQQIPSASDLLVEFAYRTSNEATGTVNVEIFGSNRNILLSNTRYIDAGNPILSEVGECGDFQKRVFQN